MAVADTAAAGPPPSRRSGLARDAVITIATRFSLAVLIFATDILIARALGPAAKGRFTLVLLYSQLAAVVIGFGMDQALGVVAGRSLTDARRGVTNAIVWTAVVGGASVLVSLWLFVGLDGGIGQPDGPLSELIPNLSSAQFTFGALAIPAELAFSLGLFALLGRREVATYSGIRLLRRASLLVLLVAVALAAQLDLTAVLILNLVALVVTFGAIAWASARAGLLGGSPSSALLGEELRFGSKAVVGTLAERLQFRADVFIVNALIGIRATGIYSVTSGIAETLWYVPNALGVVMFSRAVDPTADAGRTAAVLTRTTLALSILLAIPTAIFGPRLVRFVYGPQFADAGVALRLILPGVVAYSVVAVLSRYLTGRGRPGTSTLILLLGLGSNIAANLILVPVYGILGAAAASSISYTLTAIVILAVFARVSGRGLAETLVIRRSDLAAAVAAGAAMTRRPGRRVAPAPEPGPGPVELPDPAAELIIGEHSPGEES
jgi:O-antigen/teichoic acid export membrane protein